MEFPRITRIISILTMINSMFKLQKKKGLDVRDYGDIQHHSDTTDTTGDISNMFHLSDVANCTNRLSKQIQQVLRDGRQALTIGGDHSLGIGTIDGHVKVAKKKGKETDRIS